MLVELAQPPGGCLFEFKAGRVLRGVVVSADSQSLLNHCGNFRIQIYPNDCASGMLVRDRLAQRPSMLQHPRDAVFEILADLAFRNPRLAKARF